MINKTAITISLVSAILFVSPLLAEDSTTKTAVKPIQERMQDRQTNLQNKIDTRKMALDKRIATKEANFQERLEKEKQIFEKRRLMEASKEAVFIKKLEDRKQKIASHEAEMRAKFQAFKDRQKAKIADRVNINLNKVNQKQTEQMLIHLDSMSKLLDKLTERVNSGSKDIKDSSTANQAISDARGAIDTARTAVQAQAQKDYSITVTEETKIRLDAKAKRDQLYKDIMTTRKLVIDAKQAVSNAVRVSKTGKVATESAEVKEGTTSGQQ